MKLLTSRHLCNRENLGKLVALWAHILATKSGVGCVVADALDPARVLHFGFAVFVRDERAEYYHRCARPKIALSLLKEWADNRRPFLNRDEIARANATTGLNLLVLHYGRVVPSSGELERLRAASYDSSRRVLRGWNMRTYTNEVFARDPQLDGQDMGRALGFRLGRYTDEQLREAGIPLDEAPWVWMATLDDVSGPTGVALAELFHSFRVPRFGFTPAEQDLLRFALDGFTDQAIAGQTGTSVATVKKRLRSVYAKVHDSYAAGGGHFGAATLINGVRGTETRRRLLNYLRDHPSELWPYD
ncbi:MAG: hypothetical protein JO199_14515, partial [Candidatus Eremiobacteraeota bacterium]|nr:hypothetical protein [Candidatus Eremiobacteraeota bacterium]